MCHKTSRCLTKRLDVSQNVSMSHKTSLFLTKHLDVSQNVSMSHKTSRWLTKKRFLLSNFSVTLPKVLLALLPKDVLADILLLQWMQKTRPIRKSPYRRVRALRHVLPSHCHYSKWTHFLDQFHKDSLTYLRKCVNFSRIAKTVHIF